MFKGVDESVISSLLKDLAARLKRYGKQKTLFASQSAVRHAFVVVSGALTSKKGDKAKYAVELVWRGDKLFAGHVTRTWKGVVDSKSANLTASGTAEVK